MTCPEGLNCESLTEIDSTLAENLTENDEALLDLEDLSNNYVLIYATTSLRDALQRDLGQAEDLTEGDISTYESRVEELDEYLVRIAEIYNLERTDGEYPGNMEVTEGDIDLNMHDIELSIDEFHNILLDARDQLEERNQAVEVLEAAGIGSEAAEIADEVQSGTIDTPEQAAQALSQTRTVREAREQDEEGGGFAALIKEVIDAIKEWFASLTGFTFFNGNNEDNEAANEANPNVNIVGTQLVLENSGLSGSHENYPAINRFPSSLETQSVEFEGREPSGIVHTPFGFFMVDDSGDVLRLSEDFTILDVWTIGGDLEGITYDPSTGRLYVIEEGDQLLRELSYENGNLRLTGNEWDLSSLIPYNHDGSGIEAVAFVNGVFYVGDQHDGRIHIIDISSGSAIEMGVIDPPIDVSRDVSGLYYEESSGLLYAIWDSDDRLALIDTTTNSYVCQFHLPSDNQEGITLDANRNVVIGEDTGAVQRL